MQKLAAISLLLLPIAAHAFKNEPDGFRGIAWGDDQIMNAEQFNDAGSNERHTLYRRKEENMKIGGAELADILYGYRDGKLEIVLIKTQPGNNSEMIAAFKEQFGSGKKPNRFMDKYLWDGSKTKMMLECNSIQDICMATIMSAKSLEDYSREKKQRAKEAGKDF
jgi:predicted DNA-binding ArsR family transcriptional regulator